MVMREKQQVVFIGRVLWAGGAERVVYDLAHGLDRERYEPHVVCLFEQQNVAIAFAPAITVHCVGSLTRVLMSKAHENDVHLNLLKHHAVGRWGSFLTRKYIKWEGKLRRLLGAEIIQNPILPVDSGVSELSLFSKSVTDWWPFVEGLQRILKNFRDDALLVPIMEEAIVLVWLSQLLGRRPYVAFLHSIESYNMQLIYPNPKRLVVEEWMFANACRSAEVVTVPSNGCRDDLVRNYRIRPDHIRVVPNPVDLDLLRAKSRVPNAPLMSNEGTKFVYVGRLDQDKNPALLIEAARLLRQKYDIFVVYLAGKGALINELQSLIQANNLQEHVILLDELTNPYPLISQARSLILTSRVESFSLVLVDAMLFGAVPISVDCPFGLREILDNGRFGLLVPPEDAMALADAMWRVACDDGLHSGFKKLGLERAQHYGLPAVVPEWERIFDLVQKQEAHGSKEKLY